MEITKLQKEVILEKGECRITVEIVIKPGDMTEYDYGGLDLISDEDIPDILLAVSRKFTLKKGKICRTAFPKL